MSDDLIAHYAEHAQHKLREYSSELEMFESVINSHRAQSKEIQLLTQELVERFQAVELLALALRHIDPQIFEDICKQSPYLTMLKERGFLD
ncbi:MAG: hypothetical protein IT320_10150 [Anaerolineae bacterium]|nr:hypothetical protein [Anaerolineae bacterium]